MRSAYKAIFGVGVIIGLGMWLWFLFLGIAALWPTLQNWSIQEYGGAFGWLGPLVFWSAVLVLLHLYAQRKKLSARPPAPSPAPDAVPPRY